MERRKRHEPIRNAMIQKLESGSESSQETAKQIKEMLAQREFKFFGMKKKQLTKHLRVIRNAWRFRFAQV